MEFDLSHEHEETISHNHHPDFSAEGYQVISELGRNLAGGRITYLAKEFNSHTKVVIKQFCSANTTADWSGVKAYEQEIELLQKCHHPRIPCYVDSFEKPGFFYLVQEYKNAPSLGLKRCFYPQEIKQIALSILEILVYLQQQVPAIIHRDIKPDNILVDTELNAYLVDFGLARLQDAKIDFSTLVAGTPGFMPPEEQCGHELTAASDLYSLGATLICLFTNTRSVDIDKLIDHKYRWNFQKLLPYISPHFLLWLKKMVEPNSKHRYTNAADALQALKPVRVIGSGTKIDYLFAAIYQKKNIVMLGLVTIAILAVLGTTLRVSQPSSVTNSIEIQNFLNADEATNSK
ncbi:serine/threonine-protein kinase [Anabaena sp. PCC 7108]|uniref:serine/threonine protein kinase n=1 Tax=Anabaena sp. PCC 7108 TaxID=163908 RepID=UPI000346F150|nr:serine/threonine-protein kinase [Anabaena sp. PCC 7108]